MPIATNTMKNVLAEAYANKSTGGLSSPGAAFAALYTTVPAGSSPGTEVSGGSPAYARKAITWGTAANGVVSATVTFDVPSGATVRGAGVHTLATGGAYLDGGSVTEQAFASQGTYTLTLTYTQS